MENFETKNEEGALLINIYSPNLPSITIIDLPPIINKNETDSFYITEKISKKLIYNYINYESTIILCVIPVNSDYENNDG